MSEARAGEWAALAPAERDAAYLLVAMCKVG
jgi:hypothetical protein